MSDLLDEALATLRRSFDQAFAEAPAARAGDPEELLAVRVGGAGFALRVRELAALSPRRRVVPLAGARSGLLGICGVRGVAIPVFHLASFVDGAASTTWRWLALCAGGVPLALAFDDLDGLVRVEGARIHALAPGSQRPHVRGAVHHDGRTLGLVDLPSIATRLLAGVTTSTTAT